MNVFSCIQRLRIASRDSKLSWLTLVASILILLCSFGFLQSFGILYNAFIEQYKSSKEVTAWVGSIPMSLMAILAPIASYILNRFSLRLVTALNAIPVGLCLFLTPFARNIHETLFIFSIPFGIASSMLFLGGFQSLQIYFDKRLVTASGLMSGGCALSQVGFSYILIGLLNRYSLEQTLRILGGIITSICIFASQFFLPTSYEHKKQESGENQKRGFLFYLQLLKNKQFATFVFANFVCCFAYGVSSVHQVQLAVEYGMDQDIARQFPVFTAISNALGRVCCGFIVDAGFFKFKNYYPMTLILNAMVSLAGFFSSSPTHLIIYIWVYAFTDGIIQICSSTMVRDILGLNTFTEGYAVLLTVDSVSIMLGPPLIGFIVDQTSDYRAFFYVAGLPPLLSAMIIYPIRYIKTSQVAKDGATDKLYMDEETDSNCNKIDKNKIEKLMILMETPV